MLIFALLIQLMFFFGEDEINSYNSLIITHCSMIDPSLLMRVQPQLLQLSNKGCQAP